MCGNNSLIHQNCCVEIQALCLMWENMPGQQMVVHIDTAEGLVVCIAWPSHQSYNYIFKIIDEWLIVKLPGSQIYLNNILLVQQSLWVRTSKWPFGSRQFLTISCRLITNSLSRNKILESSGWYTTWLCTTARMVLNIGAANISKSSLPASVSSLIHPALKDSGIFAFSPSALHRYVWMKW